MISDERKAQMRSRIEYLKARQRCVVCAQQDAYTLVGRALCGDCCERRQEAHTRWREQNRERNNAREMDRYQRLKAAGLCVSCGRERDRTGVYCRRCAAKKAEKRRIRYAAETTYLYGQCRWCRQPSVQGKAYCQDCLDKMSKDTKAWWERIKRSAEEPREPM